MGIWLPTRSSLSPFNRPVIALSRKTQLPMVALATPRNLVNRRAKVNKSVHNARSRLSKAERKLLFRMMRKRTKRITFHKAKLQRDKKMEGLLYTFKNLESDAMDCDVTYLDWEGDIEMIDSCPPTPELLRSATPSSCGSRGSSLSPQTPPYAAADIAPYNVPDFLNGVTVKPAESIWFDPRLWVDEDIDMWGDEPDLVMSAEANLPTDTSEVVAPLSNCGVSPEVVSDPSPSMPTVAEIRQEGHSSPAAVAEVSEPISVVPVLPTSIPDQVTAIASTESTTSQQSAVRPTELVSSPPSSLAATMVTIKPLVATWLPPTTDGSEPAPSIAIPSAIDASSTPLEANAASTDTVASPSNIVPTLDDDASYPVQPAAESMVATPGETDAPLAQSAEDSDEMFDYLLNTILADIPTVVYCDPESSVSDTKPSTPHTTQKPKGSAKGTTRRSKGRTTKKARPTSAAASSSISGSPFSFTFNTPSSKAGPEQPASGSNELPRSPSDDPGPSTPSSAKGKGKARAYEPVSPSCPDSTFTACDSSLKSDASESDFLLGSKLVGTSFVDVPPPSATSSVKGKAKAQMNDISTFSGAGSSSPSGVSSWNAEESGSTHAYIDRKGKGKAREVDIPELPHDSDTFDVAQILMSLSADEAAFEAEMKAVRLLNSIFLASKDGLEPVASTLQAQNLDFGVLEPSSALLGEDMFAVLSYQPDLPSVMDSQGSGDVTSFLGYEGHAHTEFISMTVPPQPSAPYSSQSSAGVFDLGNDQHWENMAADWLASGLVSPSEVRQRSQTNPS